jgi:serine/threonine protein kinase
METTAQSVENMCNLLIRSRLLQATDVQLMHRRWRLEARDASNDVNKFARWLVQNQYLTEFQANAVIKGHVDHFFLGQYKLLDRIGKGRMAGVYKGLHNLGNIVAVKVLPPSKVRDPQVLARFQREAKMAVKLNHPNVVRAFHMGSAGGLYYLVMEYLEGETLEEVLKRRSKLPVGESVRLIHQALLGLQHIHEQGLVHRDIKPANLMLVQDLTMTPAPAPRSATAAAPSQSRDRDGAEADNTLSATVKILDIGLGRAMFDESAPDMDNMQLTTEGAVLGTPDYLAPEQARDAHKADIRADIYSAGCLLYHLIGGQVPFPAKNALQVIVRHSQEQAKPLRELDPAVPEALQQVVQKMMAKQPDQRFAAPGQAAQALQPLLPGREVARPAAAGPHMQSYLKWVDTENSKEMTSPPPESASRLPVATPMPPEANVELVPVLPNGPPPAVQSASSRFTKRDYFLIAMGVWIGAAAVLIIEAFIWLALSAKR